MPSTSGRLAPRSRASASVTQARPIGTVSADCSGLVTSMQFSRSASLRARLLTVSGRAQGLELAAVRELFQRSLLQPAHAVGSELQRAPDRGVAVRLAIVGESVAEANDRPRGLGHELDRQSNLLALEADVDLLADVSRIGRDHCA